MVAQGTSLAVRVRVCDDVTSPAARDLNSGKIVGDMTQFIAVSHKI
jgi:hypothetical protein